MHQQRGTNCGERSEHMCGAGAWELTANTQNQIRVFIPVAQRFWSMRSHGKISIWYIAR
jgi:hypothetical protein